MQADKRQKGFTLIEVMVALAVVAIALSALSQASANFLWNQTALEQRVIGNWVAQNEITQLQTGLLKHPRANANEKMMGHSWQIKSRTESTPIPGVVKLSIDVLSEAAVQDNKKQTPVASLVTVWEQQRP